MNTNTVTILSMGVLMLASSVALGGGGKGLLQVGAGAPRLRGVDQQGRTHTLAETRGAFTLVYFYPKDQTPGCTKEACAFRNVWKKYEAAGVKIFGVSNGSVKSHKKFSDKHNLPFPLIADEDKAWGSAFGVGSFWGMYKRVSFLIDKQGKIAKVYNDVDPGLHATQVLEDVQKLSAGS
jgi:peroxiredoxin Q/BCP